jgi:hypothetical protein
MDEKKNSRRVLLSLIWTPIIVIILAIVTALTYTVVKPMVIIAPLQNFDEMVVTDGFHSISLPSGQHFDVTYEKDVDSVFDGMVRHTSMNHETSFPILSFDVLVTTGDYSDPDKVTTDVRDHHFYWAIFGDGKAYGTINLLHTVPMDQSVEEQLMSVKNGDHVIVIGREILKIDGYSRSGRYVGYWQDAGCNTILITKIYVNP